MLRVTAGNFLEQFDFFLFGFYATQIAAVFFPAGSEFASLMMTFAVFGAGFLMRPLGAIILGAYIDDVGRRKGLIVTLSIMASGTILIAFVPGYATIGLFAPAPGSHRPSAAGLLGGRGTGRGIGVSRRNGDAGPQGLLHELAVGEPASGDRHRRRARLRAQSVARHGGDRRVGMARAVLRRLHDRAFHLHPAAQSRGNARNSNSASIARA